MKFGHPTQLWIVDLYRRLIRYETRIVKRGGCRRIKWAQALLAKAGVYPRDRGWNWFFTRAGHWNRGRSFLGATCIRLADFGLGGTASGLGRLDRLDATAALRFPIGGAAATCGINTLIRF